MALAHHLILGLSLLLPIYNSMAGINPKTKKTLMWAFGANPLLN
jgi:hypothetical protein